MRQLLAHLQPGHHAAITLHRMKREIADQAPQKIWGAIWRRRRVISLCIDMVAIESCAPRPVNRGRTRGPRRLTFIRAVWHRSGSPIARIMHRPRAMQQVCDHFLTTRDGLGVF
ncbi:hypothetical protein ACFQ4K_27715 [Tistrella bauzanensis]